MGPSRFPSERLPSESDQSESFQSELFGQNVSWNHNYGQIKKKTILIILIQRMNAERMQDLAVLFCSEQKSKKLTYL